MSRHDSVRAGLSQVNFVCQKCCQPLRIDNSLYAAQAKDLSQLSAPFTKDQVDGEKCSLVPNKSGEQFQTQGSPDKSANSNVSRKEVVSTRVSSDSGNDFTLLGETGGGGNEILSQKVQIMSHLFDIMSEQSEVDHPLCTDCTDTLLDQLDQQLKITEDECKDYRDFLEKVSSDKDSIKEDDLDCELEQLRAEEKSLQQQLESIEADFSHLEGQVRIEQAEAKRLEEEESRYWKSYNEYKRQLLEYEDAQKSIEHQLKYGQAQLDKLKKTNVFNATFHIWHSGHFGTINNFRLGRLPSVPVDWQEINAAWGQTVLLLHSLANKMNLKFERYRLVPYGSHSYLESLTDKSKELPLYASGGFKFFWDTKFDQAMVAFLDCLQQFKEEVERGDSSFCLPYKMEKGRIEDTSTGTSYSIKIQFNSEEQWTKALKFMLTNLKWGLAWVSSQFANK